MIVLWLIGDHPRPDGGYRPDGSRSPALRPAQCSSNVPESLSAARKAGHSSCWILGLWTGVALLSTAAGYGLLGGASPVTTAVVQAFAAGAILTMLADMMMPEGFEHAGSTVGLVTSLGFIVVFLLSQAGG